LIEEILGFLGYIILMFALLQHNTKKLRIFNIISTIIFLIQSIVYKSISLFITNISIILINIFMIKKGGDKK
jgi:membrane-bound ClpP family serine protease